MLAFTVLTSLITASLSIDLANRVFLDGFCAWTVTDSHSYEVSYNLSKFYIPDNEDTENEVEDEDQTRKWKYMFNVCGALSQSFLASSQYPSKCKYDASNLVPPCETGFINETSGKCIKYVDMSSKQEAVAIQLETDEDTSDSDCYWLASYDTVDGNDYTLKETVELFDTEDSARGIIYSMYDGSYCEAAKKNRELRIIFKCPDSQRQYFSPSEEQLIINETVAEYPTCVYNILIESPLACPTQCLHANVTKLRMKPGEAKQKETLYSVCNGKGICAMDEREAKARCICDDGWSGDRCEKVYDDHKHIDETNKSIQILVIFCIVILAIVFVLAAWLYTKLQNAKNLNLVGNSVNQAASLAQPIALDSQDQVIDTTTVHQREKKRTRIPTNDEEDIFPSDNVVDTPDRVIEEEDNLHEDPSTKDEVNI